MKTLVANRYNGCKYAFTMICWNLQIKKQMKHGKLDKVASSRLIIGFVAIKSSFPNFQ